MPKYLSPEEHMKAIHLKHDDPCFYCGGETFDVLTFPLHIEERLGVRVVPLPIPFCSECFEMLRNGKGLPGLHDMLLSYLPETIYGKEEYNG